MAKVGRAKPLPKPLRGGPRRVSPLKPGLSGARNWATAQIRAASYSRKRMARLVMGGLFLGFMILWMALWLGGFIPNIKASTHDFTKHRLMSMGFVVKQVDIVGEGRIREDKVRGMLGVAPGDYLFDMDIKSAQSRVQSLAWVESVVVRRLWPDRIVVHINERTPYALWQENGEIKLVDNSGFVITDANIPDFTALPFVVGKGGAVQASAFYDTLSAYPALKAQTETIVYVGERRWDIVLKGGVRIMLPEGSPMDALKRLEKYNHEHGVLGLDVERIDMRVEGRLSLTPRPKGARRS